MWNFQRSEVFEREVRKKAHIEAHEALACLDYPKTKCSTWLQNAENLAWHKAGAPYTCWIGRVVYRIRHVGEARITSWKKYCAKLARVVVYTSNTLVTCSMKFIN
jgi:hypothetical protein